MFRKVMVLYNKIFILIRKCLFNNNLIFRTIILLILGLDNAGKTSVLNCISGGIYIYLDLQFFSDNYN